MPHGVRQDVDLKGEYDVAEPDKNCVSETSAKPGRLNILPLDDALPLLHLGAEVALHQKLAFDLVGHPIFLLSLTKLGGADRAAAYLAS